MNDSRDIAIDGELHERFASWCRAFDVAVDAVLEELLADLPQAVQVVQVVAAKPRARRVHGARAEIADERVIQHAELVRRLAADREANALGDTGGMFGAKPSSAATAIVGPSSGTREVCFVHGWVGRHRFEEDNHAACDPVGDQCLRCSGRGYASGSSKKCERCGGTRIEPAHVVFDETLIEREPAKVQASEERIGPLDRGGRRRPKRNRPRAKTISTKRFTKTVLRALAAEVDDVDVPDRPRVRSECPTGPCPWVGCRHHLYLDINPETGSIKINFPDLEVEDLVHSCALDAAELGPHTLEAAAEKMNITRERTRQVEVIAYFNLATRLRARGVDGPSDVDPVGNAPEAVHG